MRCGKSYCPISSLLLKIFLVVFEFVHSRPDSLWSLINNGQNKVTKTSRRKQFSFSNRVLLSFVQPLSYVFSYVSMLCNREFNYNITKEKTLCLRHWIAEQQNVAAFSIMMLQFSLTLQRINCTVITKYYKWNKLYYITRTHLNVIFPTIPHWWQAMRKTYLDFVKKN